MKDRLNIGCGLDKWEGFINLDRSPEVKPDIVCDIEEGLPFDDNSMKEVYVYDVLEQISTPKDLVYVLNEIWRITKPEGFVMVRVPNAKFIEAFQDPMDVRRFTEDTFTYFQHTHYHWKRLGKSYGFKPWTVVKNDNPNRVMLTYCIRPVK